MVAQSTLEFHEWHTADPVTMSAYQNAIHQVVKPGNIVLDLGAGLGILSYHACAAGAARVHAVEPQDVIGLVPRIAAANDFQDLVVVHKGNSFDVQISEPADVMIASMIDAFGIDNNLLEIVIEARSRLLKPGGIIIPASLRMGYCPVELPEWYRTCIDCWNEDRFGFSFRAVRSKAVNQSSGKRVMKESLLAAPRYFEDIQLVRIESPNVADRGVFLIERGGVLHALAGWCEFEMAPNIRVSNSPLDNSRMTWANCVLPLERAVTVAPGYTVEVSIRAVTMHREMTWIWDAIIRDSAGTVRDEFHHSTFYGLFFSKSDLARRDLGLAPSLSDRGIAQRIVLDLCNGETSLGEIAKAIQIRFPRLFSTQAEARGFATSILNELTTIEVAEKQRVAQRGP